MVEAYLDTISGGVQYLWLKTQPCIHSHVYTQVCAADLTLIVISEG